MTETDTQTTERKILNLLIALKAVRFSILEYDYNDLLFQERMYLKLLGVVNGCGGKDSMIPVPNLRFTFCCNCHDWGYCVGGTEQDRKRIDHKFLNAMLMVGKRLTKIKRWVNVILAYDYFIAVRLLGRKFFNFTTK